ncbi:hypothetical protein HanRHA438_Chr09g0382321 [Helianthus annuus]|nr:hypothetical protein HanRHA438_Chr09g0382321 [Helianthus annuus]
MAQQESFKWPVFPQASQTFKPQRPEWWRWQILHLGWVPMYPFPFFPLPAVT